MKKSESANGQIQKMAIHFEFGHSLILAIRSKVIVDDKFVSMNLVKFILNYLCDIVFEKIQVRNFLF